MNILNLQIRDYVTFGDYIDNYQITRIVTGINTEVWSDVMKLDLDNLLLIPGKPQNNIQFQVGDLVTWGSRSCNYPVDSISNPTRPMIAGIQIDIGQLILVLRK